MAGLASGYVLELAHDFRGVIPLVTMSSPAPVTTRTVDTVELFFDLVFVVVVMQLTDLLRGEPDAQDFLTVAGLLVLVWTAWLNVTTFANLGGVTSNQRRIPILVSTAGVALIAISIPHVTGEGAAVFAIGYAVARLAMWPLWLRVVTQQGRRALLPTFFGPVLALLWLTSIPVPAPARTWYWAVLAGVEIVILVRGFTRARLIPAHLVERVGLFTMIVLGESVAEVILAVGAKRSFETWLIAAFGFAMIVAFWWMYFQKGRAATARVLEARSVALVRDVLGAAHYLVILGLIGVAAGLGGAIENADEPTLARGVLFALAGGVVLYESAQVLIVWRYGLPVKVAAAWGLLTLVLATVVVSVGGDLPPWVAVAALLAGTLARLFFSPSISRLLEEGNGPPAD